MASGPRLSEMNETEINGILRGHTRPISYVPNNEQNTSWTSWYQQYEYDSLNRLTHFWEAPGNSLPNWHRGYSYDRWGNRTVNGGLTWGGGTDVVQFGVDQNTNRLTVPANYNGTMSYDSAGN